jgi:hypothetical protein
VGELPRLAHQIGGWHDAVHEPQTESVGGGNLIARQQQLQRGAPADEPGQPLRAGVPGNDAEIDLGLTQSRRLRGDTQGAGHRQLAPSAERVAVDRRHDGLAKVFDQVEDVLPAHRVIAAAGGRLHRQLVDVGAGDEGLVAAARDDHRPDALVPPEREHRAAQLVERLQVERIEDFGPVDRDRRDTSVPIDQNVLERVEAHDQGLSIPHRRRAAAVTPSSTATPAPVLSATRSSGSGERPGTNAWCASSETPYRDARRKAASARPHVTPLSRPSASARNSKAPRIAYPTECPEAGDTPPGSGPRSGIDDVAKMIAICTIAGPQIQANRLKEYWAETGPGASPACPPGGRPSGPAACVTAAAGTSASRARARRR